MIVQLPMTDKKVAVLFRLPAAIWADSITLVGDFNGWNTSATPMRQSENYWEAQLTLAAGKTYYYAYLVDGVDWCTEAGTGVSTAGMNPPPITFVPIEIEQARRGAFSNHHVAG